MSKGSLRRPKDQRYCTARQFERRWRRAFAPNKKPKEKRR